MKRVLLIDDDPIFVFLAKKLLETIDSTLRIDIFVDGELAIGHIDKVKNDPGLLPDVIFLDLNMPVLDGWGFLDQYSLINGKLSKKSALYILSSSISPIDVIHSTDYPLVLGYLTKPLDKTKMEEILSSV